MKRIYIICAVRNATPHMRAALEAYTDMMEDAGHTVHLPHRDTDQDATGMEINMGNGAAITLSQEVHVFWDDTSKGSHFDLGMAYMLDMLVGQKKRIRMISYGGVGRTSGELDEYGEFIKEWLKEQSKSGLYLDNEIDNILPNFTN